LVIKVQDLLLQ